jgi:hypothetical protein
MSHERRRPDSPRAIRLTFTSDEGDLKLVNARRLSMQAPPGDRTDTDERDDRVGGWVEVQGSNGNVLYRRRMRPPAEDAEVSDGAGTLRRAPTRVSRLVSVLVPDVEGARRVVLRERRPKGEQREKPDVVDHASVSLEAVEGDDTLDGDAPTGDDDSSSPEER